MTWTSVDGYGSHAETSVPTPALTWYLAEGATHSAFNLFYLLQNAATVDANVQVTYLLPAPAAPLVRSYVVAANSRLNIWVDLEGPQLADTAVSTTITSTNGVPVIVERSMWWPGSSATWHEAHYSPGATSTGTLWTLAEGEVTSDAPRRTTAQIVVERAMYSNASGIVWAAGTNALAVG